MATSKNRKLKPTQPNTIKIDVKEQAPNPEPIQVPPFSMDFNFGLGIRTIVLPNGMDVLTLAKIYTDLLEKYQIPYEIVDKPIPNERN